MITRFIEFSGLAKESLEVVNELVNSQLICQHLKNLCSYYDGQS